MPVCVCVCERERERENERERERRKGNTGVCELRYQNTHTQQKTVVVCVKTE